MQDKWDLIALLGVTTIIAIAIMTLIAATSWNDYATHSTAVSAGLEQCQKVGTTTWLWQEDCAFYGE